MKNSETAVLHDKHSKSSMQHVNFSVYSDPLPSENLTLTFDPYSFTCSHFLYHLYDILKQQSYI